MIIIFDEQNWTEVVYIGNSTFLPSGGLYSTNKGDISFTPKFGDRIHNPIDSNIFAFHPLLFWLNKSVTVSSSTYSVLQNVYVYVESTL